MRDGNGNYQKGFPLFGMGTGNIKYLFRYSGREREEEKKSSRCLGTGIQDIPVGIYTETEFPLMPAVSYKKSVGEMSKVRQPI